MLETVLKIGKAFRQSSDGLRHHRYIKPCPSDTEKPTILRLSVPVNKDFSFEIGAIEEITDENISQKLLFNKFKTSDADGLVKYIFSDIYCTFSKGKIGGYYRLADLSNRQKAYKISSFHRGKDDFNHIKRLYEKQLQEHELSQQELEKKKNKFSISLFREEFEKNIKLIERIIRYQCGINEYLNLKRNGDKRSFLDVITDEAELKKLTARQVFTAIQGRFAKKTFKKLFDDENVEWNDVEVSNERIQRLVDYSTGELFLHFDFEGKHWYEFEEELGVINQKLLEDFVKQADEVEGFILKKFLYKTLDAGNYKAKLFSNVNEVLDLLYAVDYASKPLLNIKSTDIKIIVLPRGENLTAEHYEKFRSKNYSLDEESKGETQIKVANQPDDSEFIFKDLIENIDNNIVQLDLIFCKKGGATSPDTDLIEISAIDKSFLKQQVGERIARIKAKFYNQFDQEKYKKPLNIIDSFQSIFKSPASDMKKYKKHMLKVLPQIYTATYYRDPILLPALIERVQFEIRNSDKRKSESLKSEWRKVQFEIRNSDKPETNYMMFKSIKFDFYFLTTIQNIEPEGGNLMKIQESQSYKIGTLLGKLAQNFAGTKSPIKSFEKSYVGHLLRRIGTFEDLYKFKAFIDEKIVIHEKNYESNRSVSLELTQVIKNFSGRYNKYECAFGFFESYFSPFIIKNDLDKE